MRVIVRMLAEKKRRISAYLSEGFKRKIDYALRDVGWSENEFVQRAIERLFPELDDLAKRLREEVR